MTKDNLKEKYPELSKLKGRMDEHRHIQQFCWYLQANGLLYQRKENPNKKDTFWALNDSDIAKVISEYFEIDYQEFENERRKMLKEIRNDHD